MGSGAVPENYIPILIFIGAAIAVGTVTLFLGRFVRPNHPYRAKMAPYESGSPLFQDARVQFPMRYYIIAMLFVIFDIEIVFMFPWAVVFTKLGLLGLVEMAVFIAILIVGFWYAWKKGALEWE
ncbi:MAG: NAD(P)H-quinone oxidoreductase subunit 3 [Nitrospira sp.]|nr:NAD(P)H-quinone oxidoreductase subunit 3 [Nitrospira sp.]MBH0197338.1 NAD(P)H-quinone oxidoreductase subunit 3 [Nitrospira sp.]